jgi:hypothetical protein
VNYCTLASRVINSRIRFFATPDDACRYCCASNYEQDQSIASCYTYRVFNTRIYRLQRSRHDRACMCRGRFRRRTLVPGRPRASAKSGARIFLFFSSCPVLSSEWRFGNGCRDPASLRISCATGSQIVGWFP